MKYVLALCLLASGCASKQAVVSKATDVTPLPSYAGAVCFMPGEAPEGAVQVGKLVATKKSYGSDTQLLPELAKQARRLGANVVSSYSAAQKFKGPIPWRAVAPTGAGMAVFVPNFAECDKFGGTEVF